MFYHKHASEANRPGRGQDSQASTRQDVGHSTEHQPHRLWSLGWRERRRVFAKIGGGKKQDRIHCDLSVYAPHQNSYVEILTTKHDSVRSWVF